MKESSLKKRYLLKLISGVVNGIVGMLLVAIVPKAIGPISYGQFVYYQQFFIKIVGFFDAASSIAFFTKLSAKPERRELLSFYGLYSLAILCIILLIFYTLSELGFIHQLLPEVEVRYLYIAIIFSFFTWLSQVFISISDAYALTVSTEIVKIVHKILSLIVLVIYINEFEFNLEGYFYFNVFSLIFFVMTLSVLFQRKKIFSCEILYLKFVNIKRVFKEFFLYCYPLFTYSLVGLLVGVFDIWLLQLSSGSIETGFYGLAYSLAAMCFIFTGAMTPIITREFSQAFSLKKNHLMRANFNKYIPLLYSVAAFFSIYISFQSENVLSIFTDESFSGAYWALVVVSFYPIHQTYGQLSGAVFFATGKTPLYRNIGLFSMGTGVILSLIFVSFLDMGALGLAFKMVFTQIIAVNIQLYFNMKQLRLKMVSFLSHQVIVIVFFSIIAFLATNFVSVASPVLSFIFSGMIYSTFVLVGVYLFPRVIFVSRTDSRTFKLFISNKFNTIFK